MNSTTVGVSILIVSDSAALDPALDRSGPTLKAILSDYGGGKIFRVVETRIVADEVVEISGIVKIWSERHDIDWIITSGGTGFGVRDRTPEVSMSRTMTCGGLGAEFRHCRP